MNPRNSTMFHRDTTHAVTGLLMQTYGGVAAKLLDAGIDLTREMRTVDGDRVRLIALDTDHKFGLVGEIIDEGTATCWLARWNLTGTYCGTLDATQKHSIAKNSATVGKGGARLADGVKYYAAPEPVHDMGLDDATTAPDGPREVEDITISMEDYRRASAAVSRLVEYAKSVLQRDRNKAAPDKLISASKLRSIRLIDEMHYGKYDTVTRAYVTCALNSTAGRFRWYSMDPADFPPDAEIVEAARILTETDKLFHTMISPVLQRLYQIGAVLDCELKSRLEEVERMQKMVKARGSFTGC